MAFVRASAWVGVLFSLACNSTISGKRGDGGSGTLDGTSPVGDVPRFDGQRYDAPSYVACNRGTDADGDGIPDDVESTFDSDGDGTPDRTDTDSDNDGVLDRDESRIRGNCVVADSDSDGTLDYRDTDSDNDGLFDSEEAAAGTDPTNRDTDGDGVTDLGEIRGTLTNPLDSTSTVPPGDYFVVLPYNAPAQRKKLRFGSNVSMADVYFFMDTTASMYPELRNVQNGLESVIIPGIKRLIPNVHFGAGGFADYPVGTDDDAAYGMMRAHGLDNRRTECRAYNRCDTVAAGCCPDTDIPFFHLLDISPPDQDHGEWGREGPFGIPPQGVGIGSLIRGTGNGVPDIVDAVRNYPRHNGGNVCEAGFHMLHVLATGMGHSWPESRWGTAGTIPSKACVVAPDDVGVRRGYPCFRHGAQPIVVYVSDAPFKDGVADLMSSTVDFAGACSLVDIPTAPQPTQVLAAIRDLGARIVTLSTSFSFPSMPVTTPDDHMCFLSRTTGAVRANGTPLCFQIGSDGLNITTDVINGISELVGGAPYDCTTRKENGTGNFENVDATRFIGAITPFEGTRGTTSGPSPGITYRSKDSTTFREVIPGTQLDFDVDFQNTFFMGRETAVIFRARIIVVGSGITDLSSRNVYIVVPPSIDSVILI